jgi:hypothetical protein
MKYPDNAAGTENMTKYDSRCLFVSIARSVSSGGKAFHMRMVN